MGACLALVDVVAGRAVERSTGGTRTRERTRGVGAKRFERARKYGGTAFIDVCTSNIAVAWLTRTRERTDGVDANA